MRAVPIADRLAAQAVRTDAGCLEFRARAKTRSGHRQVWHNGRMRLAHRVAYELANGPIPDTACVLHRCDNPPCIDPAHLWLGDVPTNNADRDAKGRHVALRGSANGNATLTERDVTTILGQLAAGTPQRTIAAEHCVSQALVSLIHRGKAWAHVTRP